MILLEPTERLEQTVVPIARNGLRFAPALLFQIAAPDPKPLPSATTTPATPQHRL